MLGNIYKNNKLEEIILLLVVSFGVCFVLGLFGFLISGGVTFYKCIKTTFLFFGGHAIPSCIFVIFDPYNCSNHCIDGMISYYVGFLLKAFLDCFIYASIGQILTIICITIVMILVFMYRIYNFKIEKAKDEIRERTVKLYHKTHPCYLTKDGRIYKTINDDDTEFEQLVDGKWSKPINTISEKDKIWSKRLSFEELLAYTNIDKNKL